MDDLIDTAGIAELLGLKRGTVTDHVTKREDFPTPAIHLSQKTRRWRKGDVLQWAETAYQRRRAMSSADSL